MGKDHKLRSKPIAAFALVLIFSLTASLACSNSNADNGTPITVTEKDFTISLGSSTAAAGKLTFVVENDGPSTHELVVFKTNLSADALPQASGVVDEESTDLQSIDEVEDIKSGKSKKLTVDLQPGRYVLICNISGHYQLGMHAAFTVN